MVASGGGGGDGAAARIYAYDAASAAHGGGAPFLLEMVLDARAAELRLNFKCAVPSDLARSVAKLALGEIIDLS